MTVTVVAAGAVTASGNSSAGTRRHRGQVVPRTPEQVLVAVIQRDGSVRSVAATAGDEVVVVKVLRLLVMEPVSGAGSVGNLRYD